MSGDKDINIKVRIWRQKGPSDKGGLVTYDVPGVSTGSSFLEMLDLVSERLMEKGEEPVALDHDCREGICGACSLVINGVPHGPRSATTTCQLHMRSFEDGQTITVEPFRAKAFPVIKDLIVDRSAYDRIIAAGGFVSVNTGVGVDAQRDPGPEGERRARDGRGGVHRLRRLRRGLPERLGDALRRRRRSRTSASCRRGSPSGRTAS